MAQETAAEDGGEIRKKAFVRLAAAATVTALALGGLWWLERSGRRASPAPPTPSPIVPAPGLGSPAPEPPSVEELPSSATEAELRPTDAAPRVPPPPPRVGVTAALPAPSPGARERPGALPPLPPSAATGYVVQLGVFNNLANAQELVTRLRRAGIPAHTETRVHVGPFVSREAAQKAQDELRRMGLDGLIEARDARK